MGNYSSNEYDASYKKDNFVSFIITPIIEIDFPRQKEFWHFIIHCTWTYLLPLPSLLYL